MKEGKKKTGKGPRVAILMGSDSDWNVMAAASERLASFGVEHEAHVLSAHRSPEETARFARDAKKRGLEVFICGAGAAAHLAGAVSAQTTLPVLGVLGNHDYECGQPEKVAEILNEAGMTILDEQAVEIEGVGFAGVKGFMGGFGRGELAPFGEPIAKAFVDEVLTEARKLENALRSLRTERSVAVQSRP